MVADRPRRAAWLRTSEFDRTRLLDMTRRILPATLFATALCGMAAFTLLGRVGPILLIPLTLGAAGQLAIGFLFPRLKCPERWILGGDCVSVLTISWGVALTGGFESPFIPLLVLPLLAVAGRHTPLVFAFFVGLCVTATLLASAVAVNHGLDDETALASADLATLLGAAAIIVGLMRAEWHYRHQSLLDPLTGLLNRLALTRRFEELRTQAAMSDGVVCLIAADIDEFKAINDAHGHDVGDTVLRDVAEALRSNLRSFSLLYRMGGEEFVAVLPGLSCEEGQLLAERLRGAVEACEPNGIRVTMSFGVATSSGSQVDFERLFGAADSFLYEAKRAGRNRVVCEPAPSTMKAAGDPFDEASIGELALSRSKQPATLPG
jgi:diguanylate cyclase (GGDEF)-like protein